MKLLLCVHFGLLFGCLSWAYICYVVPQSPGAFGQDGEVLVVEGSPRPTFLAAWSLTSVCDRSP